MGFPTQVETETQIVREKRIPEEDEIGSLVTIKRIFLYRGLPPLDDHTNVR